jgi:MFS family permease
MSDKKVETASVASAPYPNPSYAWFVVFALGFTNCVSYIERSVLNILMQPMKLDFHLSDTQASLLQGFAFVLFYAVFGIYVGRLGDRKNRKWIVTIGIVFWSIATFCCSLARNFWQFFAARVSVGVGEATLGSTAISIITDYFPRRKLALALSFYTGAQYIGAGAALIVGSLLLQFATSLPPLTIPGIGHIPPWQMVFMFVGLGGSVVLLPMLFVKEPVRRGLIPGSDAAKNKKGVALRELFAFIRRNPMTFTALLVVFPANGIIGQGTSAWMPTYFIRNFGWNAHEIGIPYGISQAFLGFLGVLTGPHLLRWLENRGYTDSYLRLPLITIPITLCFQLMVPFMPTGESAFAVLCISIFLGPIPLSGQTAAMQVVTPNQMRGQIASIYLFTANMIGLAMGPTIVALFTDYLYKSDKAISFSVATTAAIIAPMVWLVLLASLKSFRKSFEEARAWNDEH